MDEGVGLRIMPNILKPAHHLFQAFARQRTGSLIRSTWAEACLSSRRYSCMAIPAFMR
jgi:hypothetical protein